MNLSTIAALRAVTSATPTQFRAGQLAHDLPGRRRSMPRFVPRYSARKRCLHQTRNSSVAARTRKHRHCLPPPQPPASLLRGTCDPRGHRSHPSMSAFTTQADPSASLATSRGPHGKRGIAILREKTLWQNLCRASQARCTHHSQSHFMCSRSSLLFSPQS